MKYIHEEMGWISTCGNYFDFIFAISVQEVGEYKKVALTLNVIFQRVGPGLFCLI